MVGENGLRHEAWEQYLDRHAYDVVGGLPPLSRCDQYGAYGDPVFSCARLGAIGAPLVGDGTVVVRMQWDTEMSPAVLPRVALAIAEQPGLLRWNLIERATASKPRVSRPLSRAVAKAVVEKQGSVDLVELESRDPGLLVIARSADGARRQIALMYDRRDEGIVDTVSALLDRTILPRTRVVARSFLLGGRNGLL